MISSSDAYSQIKTDLFFPITYVLETDDAFWSAAEDYLRVDKCTGEMARIETYKQFLAGVKNEKYVDLDEIYVDFLSFYESHHNEGSLTELYAQAWNRLFYHGEESPFKYKSKENRERIIERWREIEQILYSDIRQILDNETMDNPPCVLAKFDDPFFLIKPFMLRNGYTDNDVNRTWVRKNEPAIF